MVGIDFWQFSPFEVHLRVFFQLIPEAWPSSVARFQQSCEFLLIFWAVCRVLCLHQMFVSFQTLQRSFSKNAFRYEDHVYGFTAFHLKRRPRPFFLLILSSMWETSVVCPVVRTLTLGGSTSMTVWFALRRVLFETILGSESAQMWVFLRFGELPESEFSN